MGSVVKCRLCGDSVSYTSSQVAQLGEHLFKTHPKQSVANFTLDNGKSTESLTASEKYRMYKTTVETWKPGISVLSCPACGKTGRPIVRKQQNKIAHSSVGAICLLGCWPLCFLPFMLGGSNVMNIHCKFCGQYLGTFDRKTGRMQSFDDSLAVGSPTSCTCNSEQ
ncbi:hypothetical protein FQR65_LT03620 [Abscondita terminalis]|nr:hypothetical protein FQR65_LT03620 [Abscondita terminalis]